MENLFTSEAWKNATAHQRREFLSKVRADKQVEKDAKKKLESQKKLDAKPSKAAKKRSRQANRRIKLQSDVRTTVPNLPRPTLVAGVDVTSDAFLSTFQWRKVRMEALKKYGPRCQCCGATPATGAVMNVDHIKPRKKWPSLALDVNNLQILCHDCNHGKGNWDDTDWRS
jgi:5-methylcytosine-specific restriction endonuclease McrA